jgi:hypothetical protein
VTQGAGNKPKPDHPTPDPTKSPEARPRNIRVRVLPFLSTLNPANEIFNVLHANIALVCVHGERIGAIF